MGIDLIQTNTMNPESGKTMAGRWELKGIWAMSYAPSIVPLFSLAIVKVLYKVHTNAK